MKILEQSIVIRYKKIIIHYRNVYYFRLNSINFATAVYKTHFHHLEMNILSWFTHLMLFQMRMYSYTSVKHTHTQIMLHFFTHCKTKQANKQKNHKRKNIKIPLWLLWKNLPVHHSLKHNSCLSLIQAWPIYTHCTRCDFTDVNQHCSSHKTTH